MMKLVVKILWARMPLQFGQQVDGSALALFFAVVLALAFALALALALAPTSLKKSLTPISVTNFVTGFFWRLDTDSFGKRISQSATKVSDK